MEMQRPEGDGRGCTGERILSGSLSFKKVRKCYILISLAILAGNFKLFLQIES